MSFGGVRLRRTAGGLRRTAPSQRGLSPFDGVAMLLYRMIYHTMRPLVPLLVDIRITGSENIPRSGPVILVSNHLSYADPVVLGMACPRTVHYLGKSELFEQSRLFAGLLRRVGCVPIRRDGHASSSIRTAERLLSAGEVVGIFPEGGLKTPGELKGGVGLLAARSGAPVVCVHLEGTRVLYDPRAYLLRARRVRVHIARPLQTSDVGASSRAKFTESLLKHLQERLSAPR